MRDRARARPRPIRRSVRTGSTGVPLTSAKSPAQATPSPYQRAVADANAIFASFVVPDGARRLSAAPTVEKGVLKSPDELPETPDVVDKAGWWIVPGAPPSVLAWEARHLPHRFSNAGTGTGSGPGFTMWNQSESLPAVPGVLDSRGMVVTAVPDGHKTAIRVDAEVSWQPARPASEKVPAAARAVTISTDVGRNQGDTVPPKPVTITDPATVRALTALINGLCAVPAGLLQLPGRLRRSIWCSRSAPVPAPRPSPSPPSTSAAAMAWISPSTASRSRPWRGPAPTPARRS